MRRPSGASTSATCWASSRVGTRTRPRGAFSRRGPARRRAGSAAAGRRRASCRSRSGPRPSTSRPASASGSARAWIANGSRMSPAASARTSRGSRPSSAKVAAAGGGAAAAASRARSSSACGSARGGGGRGVLAGPPRRGRPTRNDGRGARKTRADAGRCAACGKLHRLVRGPHARQTSTTTATCGRLARGAAAKIAAYVQGYQPGWYSPSFPASTRMTSSSAVRCAPVTP